MLCCQVCVYMNSNGKASKRCTSQHKTAPHTTLRDSSARRSGACRVLATSRDRGSHHGPRRLNPIGTKTVLCTEAVSRHQVTSPDSLQQVGFVVARPPREPAGPGFTSASDNTASCQRPRGKQRESTCSCALSSITNA